jgi:multicomponent Na+:H+ antiporter subunit F
MLLATILALFASMILIVLRAFAGPSVYDRVLAVNMFGTKTVLVIAVGGHTLGWTSFADVALLYAMLNFVATIAVLRFFEATAKEPQA